VGIEQFRVYFDKEKAGASAKDLHAFYLDLKTTFAELPEVKSKTVIEEALHEYEASHPDRCVLIPSEDQFYGVSRAKNLLQNICSGSLFLRGRMRPQNKPMGKTQPWEGCSRGEFIHRSR
jgi:hypothetical protein